MGSAIEESRVAGNGHCVPSFVGLKMQAEAAEAALKNDPVSHPAHYTGHPSGVECIQITRHHNFNVGNAIKYLWRAGLKSESTLLEDLRKAVWYINDEIKKHEGK